MARKALRVSCNRTSVMMDCCNAFTTLGMLIQGRHACVRVRGGLVWEVWLFRVSFLVLGSFLGFCCVCGIRVSVYVYVDVVVKLLVGCVG